MEMRIVFFTLALIATLGSCSNTPELETGEIKTLQLLKQALEQSNNSTEFVDSRNLLSRKQIDAANIPILFVELESGQNGTLTPYPGQGVGQTWLGADGATITLERGILKASRGMGDDIMGASSSMPPWSEINRNTKDYSRQFSYITGNNRISKLTFICNINKNNQKELLKIWGIVFPLTKFEETCTDNGFEIRNIYYVDNKQIVRKSLQYHGYTIGYVNTERIDQ